MIPLILTALMTPPVEVRSIEVDLLETNTVRQEDGSIRFTQIIAWDEGRDETNRPVPIDRGYKVVKEGYPVVHSYGDRVRVVWWCGSDKCYVLTSREHLVTQTNHDGEARFRSCGGAYRPCW